MEADIFFLSTADGGRSRPVVSGYRPAHAVRDDYLTTGFHDYLDVAQARPGDTVRATITFITPDAYPHTLWVGKVIHVQEGGRVVGRATITRIFNELLLAPEQHVPEADDRVVGAAVLISNARSVEDSMRRVLTSLDIWRDGGSVSVTFTSNDSVVRTLFFQVNLSGPDSRKDGYVAPFLDERAPVAWTNSKTGNVYDEWATTRKPTSWAESARILSELATQVTNVSTGDDSIFAEMVYAAAHEGRSRRDA